MVSKDTKSLDTLSDSIRLEAQKAAQTILNISTQRLARSTNGVRDAGETVEQFVSELKAVRPKEYRHLLDYNIKSLERLNKKVAAGNDVDPLMPIKDMNNLFANTTVNPADMKTINMGGRTKELVNEEIQKILAKELLKVLLKDAAVESVVPGHILTLLTNTLEKKGSMKKQEKPFGDVPDLALGGLTPGGGFGDTEAIRRILDNKKDHTH